MMKDSFDTPSRQNPLSAATHPLLQSEAVWFAAVRNRMAEVALELHRAARKTSRPSEELAELARKLDAMASEEDAA